MNDEQLALSIGNAVLEAIKAYTPEPKVERVQVDYMTPKELAYNYGKSLSTIRTMTKEIREQIRLGRYDSNAILEGCGILIRVDVFVDYLEHRRALKDPVAAQYVEAYRGAKE